MMQRCREFFDPRNVEHSYFLERQVTRPTKLGALPELAPCYGCSTLPDDRGGLRMWYTTRRPAMSEVEDGPRHHGDTVPHKTETYSLRYATSSDGIHWDLPDLGLHEEEGSAQNNLVISSHARDADGAPLTGVHGPAGFSISDLLATDAPNAKARYAGLYLTNPRPTGPGLHLAWSDDGLHWRADPANPVMPGWQDSYISHFFDTRVGRYVLYHRPDWVHAGPPRAQRLVARSESDDLVQWDNTRVVLDTDARDAPAVATAADHEMDKEVGYRAGRDVQFYGMCVQPYNGFYLGIAQLYSEVAGWVKALLLHSHDGVDWRREPKETELIPRDPRPGWDSEMIYVTGAAPVGDRLHLYYTGWNMDHHRKVPCPPLRQGLGVATLARGRLVGYVAGDERGEILTRPFTLTDTALFLNADASRGQAKAGLTDVNATWLPGLSYDEAEPIHQDGLDLPLTWRNADLRSFVGQTVRLRITARHTTLHAFAVGGEC